MRLGRDKKNRLGTAFALPMQNLRGDEWKASANVQAGPF